MTITVIIAAFNEEENIIQCLESLSRQSRKADEIILVDDGSTDQTIKLAKKFPVKIIKANHQGRSAARNIGFRNARGEISIFAEADSISDENWILKIEKEFKKGADAVIDRKRFLNPKTCLQKCLNADFNVRYQNYKPFSAWAFKKEVLEKTGGYNEFLDQSEERELGKLVKANNFRIVFASEAIQYHKGEPQNFLEFIKRAFNAERKRAKGYLILFPREINFQKIFIFILSFLLGCFSFYDWRLLILLILWLLALCFISYLKINLRENKKKEVSQKYIIGLAVLRTVRSFALVIGFFAGCLDRIFNGSSIIKETKLRSFQRVGKS